MTGGVTTARQLPGACGRRSKRADCNGYCCLCQEHGWTALFSIVSAAATSSTPPPCRPATAPQVTALQIAALKRLGKGNKILLLDRSGGAAKAVARALAERGFGRVFVIKGGFQVGCLGWEACFGGVGVGGRVWGRVWEASFVLSGAVPCECVFATLCHQGRLPGGLPTRLVAFRFMVSVACATTLRP